MMAAGACSTGEAAGAYNADRPIDGMVVPVFAKLRAMGTKRRPARQTCMWRVAVVACSLGACVKPTATAAPASPPPAVETARTPVDARVRLRFVDVASVEITIGDQTRSVAIDAHAQAGAVMISAGGATAGVMVPLGELVDGDAPQRFAIEATAACKQPWVVDVDASLLVVGLEAHGVPSSLRIGCGPVQHVDLVTAFGVQRVVAYGDAGFDVRMVAAELGIIRSDLERIFGVHVAQRWLDEIVIEPAEARPVPRARATTTGMRVAIETAVAWDAAPRLEVGATIARIWLAKAFDVIAVPPEPTATHLHAALVHGVAHGIARESLFALGLLSPDEYADDLDRAEALVAERSHAWRVTDVVDGRDIAAAAAAHSVEAARVAWTLRETSGASNLPEALDRAAHDGDAATMLWSRLVANATVRSLGPCVVARKRPDTVLDLGIATAWDAERGDETIAALRDAGPAAAAGLRVGDRVVHVHTEGGRTRVRALRAGQVVVVDVTASARRVERRAWMRRPGIADDRCYPPS
jgi:hypothetical protein